MDTQHNFKCPKTGKGFFFPEYTMVIRGQGSVYIDKHTRKELVNPDNGETLEFIPKEFNGFPSVGKFGSLSRADRIKSLKKRSDAHNDSQKKKTGKIFKVNRSKGD